MIPLYSPRTPCSATLQNSFWLNQPFPSPPTPFSRGGIIRNMLSRGLWFAKWECFLQLPSWLWIVWVNALKNCTIHNWMKFHSACVKRTSWFSLFQICHIRNEIKSVDQDHVWDLYFSCVFPKKIFPNRRIRYRLDLAVIFWTKLAAVECALLHRLSLWWCVVCVGFTGISFCLCQTD